MSSNNFFKSDLFALHNIIQSSMILYPKELIIATLRDFFSYDSYYSYSRDQWGFTNTPDHTDLLPGADIPSKPFQQGIATRLSIQEAYRFDVIHYPAITVKNSGSRSVPISFNREQGGIQYEDLVFEDGYGNTTIIKKPSTFITAGAWEGEIQIDVVTRSLRSRDDLVELIAMCFTEIHFDTLVDIGLIVKPLSIGLPSETDDRNDKLFRQTLTLPIRTEWRREILIGNLIDHILFAVEFSDLHNSKAPVAQNLTINTEISLAENLLNIL